MKQSQLHPRLALLLGMLTLVVGLAACTQAPAGATCNGPVAPCGDLND